MKYAEVKQVYNEELKHIVTMIDDNIQTISYLDFDKKIWSVYQRDGRLNHHMYDDVFGLANMRVAVYTHYMILCNVFKLIPNIGVPLEEDKHETAEETC